MSNHTKDQFGLVGTTVAGRFKVESVVGQGGFGTVYRGTHLNMLSPVAIKCLRIPPELDEVKRKEFVARFLNEGRLMHELSRADAGIAQALEVEVMQLQSGELVPYMVLEWVDGRSLETVILEARAAGRRLPLDQLIAQLDSIARALGVAHARNIAHRDIKPSNIMLTDAMGRTTAKLLDFGIAKVIQGSGAMTSRGQESSLAFTPMYAAPEQWVARFGATGPWTDVFSLALVCVEWLTAVQALPGADASQWFGACIDPTSRPTPRERGLQVDDRVEEVFRRALALSPPDRYPNVTEFWRDLKSAARLGPSLSDAPPRQGTVMAGPSIESMVGEAFNERVPTGPRTGTVMASGSTSGNYGAPIVPNVPAPPPPTRKQNALLDAFSSLSMPVRIGGVAAVASIGVVLIAFVIHRAGKTVEDSDDPGSMGLGPAPTQSAPPAELAIGEPTPAPSASGPSPGSLSVYCVPACDSISIDQQAAGPSPLLKRTLSPGLHTVSALKLGTPAYNTTVRIPEGESRALRVWMSP